MIIPQEPTQSFAALNRPRAMNIRISREQQNVALTLMIPFRMKMFEAREAEWELGTLAIGKTVSGTDFGDRMGVVVDSSRNPLSTRSNQPRLFLHSLYARARG
jgi:hypothetical protein